MAEGLEWTADGGNFGTASRGTTFSGVAKSPIIPDRQLHLDWSTGLGTFEGRDYPLDHLTVCDRSWQEPRSEKACSFLLTHG